MSVENRKKRVASVGITAYDGVHATPLFSPVWFPTTNVAGGAALSYDQLTGADPARGTKMSWGTIAGPLSSKPFSGKLFK